MPYCSMELKQNTLINEKEVAPKRPEGGCLHYSECSNLVPGGTDNNNTLCTECIDSMRHNN